MSLVLKNLYIGSAANLSNKVIPLNEGDLNINAATEVLLSQPINVTQINLNWEDSYSQDININGILFDVVKLIDKFLSLNRKVFVNCFAGVSRSATIVIAYLIYKQNMTYQDAYDFLKSKRYVISPNSHFINQLVKLEKELQSLNPQNIMKNNGFKSLTSIPCVSTYFD